MPLAALPSVGETAPAFVALFGLLSLVVFTAIEGYPTHEFRVGHTSHQFCVCAAPDFAGQHKLKPSLAVRLETSSPHPSQRCRPFH